MKSLAPALALSAVLAAASVGAQAQTLPTAELVPQMSTQDISSDALGTSGGVVVPILTILIILLILAQSGTNEVIPEIPICGLSASTLC